jgi:hypothetical protein
MSEIVKHSDPIFAAIERHRLAYSGFVASIGPIDEAKAEMEGREVTQADRDAYTVANAAEVDALSELIATVPMTISGMRAMLEYLVRFDGEMGDNDCAGKIGSTLLHSPIFVA